MKAHAARAVAAGMPPRPEESMCSWLRRLAVHQAVPIADLLRRIGIESGSAGLGDLSTWLPVRTRKRLSAFTGVEEQRIDGLLLGRYHSTVLDLRSSFPRRYRLSRVTMLPLFVRNRLRLLPWDREESLAEGRQTDGRWLRHSRYCPKCLVEDGGVWRISWRLGGTFVCVNHGVLLCEQCPACGGFVGQDDVGAESGARLTASQLLECGNRIASSGGVCRQRLDDSPTVQVPQTVIEVQRLFLGAAEGGDMMLAGQRLTASAWATLYDVMIRLARDAAEYEPDLYLDPDVVGLVEDPGRRREPMEGGLRPYRCPYSLTDGLPRSPARMAVAAAVVAPAFSFESVEAVDGALASLAWDTYGHQARDLSSYITAQFPVKRSSALLWFSIHRHLWQEESVDLDADGFILPSMRVLAARIGSP
ncbi:TniQ family protein [Actinoplanes sp. NPDC049802]|uniref:TniQ family protein n=1 Tax=Actinoplanes sp. NPDC049802 TaxID=3154742 RepID=UPI0033CF1B86